MVERFGENIQLPWVLADNARKSMKRMREAKGLSYAELARRVKTSAQQIERLEKGERKLTLEWIERIAPHLASEPFEMVASDLERPQPFTLSLPAAEQAASTLGKVALGEEPEDSLRIILATMLQELVATFSAHPATRHDPQQLQPVVDLLRRQYARQ